MKNVTKIESITLVAIILGMIGYFIIGIGSPPHIPILFAFMLCIGFSFWKKIKWDVIGKGMQDGVSAGIIPIFIFILIGALIGIWVASGTIPTMIVYGFNVVSEEYFLVTVFITCAIVGTSVGSAFTTVATIGIAFIGMGGSLDYDLGIVAGAIISGAFFGDKMSPLSDTTNLAPTIAGADMFEHIRNMLWTTIPASLITAGLFLFVGKGAGTTSGNDIELLTEGIRQHSFVSLVTLLPCLLLFICAWKKIPAVPTLIMGILSGVVIMFLSQPELSLEHVVSIMQDGFKSNTGIEAIDALLTRGGIQSMMWSVSLIILSLGMGGILFEIGVITKVVETITDFVQTTGRLIFSTALTAIGINVLLGEQYLSIILTGRAYSENYRKLGLHPKNLSRVLEDSGTVVNPLIPWGVSGVFLAGTLGVPTFEYLPYTFFCLLCPVITVLYGFTGIGISKMENVVEMKEEKQLIS